MHPGFECGRAALKSVRQAAMRARAWLIETNRCPFRRSSRIRPWKLSANAFRAGLAGAI